MSVIYIKLYLLFIRNKRARQFRTMYVFFFLFQMLPPLHSLSPTGIRLAQGNSQH